MKKVLVCIGCPKGCRVSIDTETLETSGNACPRGAVYGRNELLHPVRVVTSTVRLEGGPTPRLNVKTDKPLPQDKMFECMALLDDVTATVPVHVGDVLLANICGTDVNIVAAKSVL